MQLKCFIRIQSSLFIYHLLSRRLSVSIKKREQCVKKRKNIFVAFKYVVRG